MQYHKLFLCILISFTTWFSCIIFSLLLYFLNSLFFSAAFSCWVMDSLFLYWVPLPASQYLQSFYSWLWTKTLRKCCLPFWMLYDLCHPQLLLDTISLYRASSLSRFTHHHRCYCLCFTNQFWPTLLARISSIHECIHRRHHYWQANIYYIASKYPATKWRLMYCKVRMQYHKLFCSVIILYHWLRLHKFPSAALFFLNYFGFSYLQLFILESRSPFPLTTSPVSESMSYYHDCGLFPSYSYFRLPFWNCLCLYCRFHPLFSYN